MFLRFFLLAVAFLFTSCTDVQRDNPYDSGGINYMGDDNIDSPPTDPSSSSDVQIGSSWDKSGTIELGGISNSTLGSFLDADAFRVYMMSAAREVEDDIDLIFDGTSFLTLEGCVRTANSLCRMMDGAYNEAILIDVSSMSYIKATSTPKEILDYIDANEDAVFNNIVTAVIARSNGKYLMATTEGNLALIIVNNVLSTNSVSLSVMLQYEW